MTGGAASGGATAGGATAGGATAGSGGAVGTGGAAPFSLGKIPMPTVALPAPNLVPSPETFFTLNAAPLPSKLVFAHYMVCCGFGGLQRTLGSAEEDIIMAQTMGINGFALNAGAWLNTTDGPAYREHVAQMFAAANALDSGFVLFFSADMTGVGSDDILAMMTAYAADPHYFAYQGRPVLSTYSGGDNHDGTYPDARDWWTHRVLMPLQAQGINTFFVPDLGLTGAGFDGTNPTTLSQYVETSVAYWSDLVQGLHSWDTLGVWHNQAGNDAQAVPIINAYAKSLGERDKIFMPLLITKYWGSFQTGNGCIYYEWQGGAGMDGQWRGAMAADVPWVEIGTWNDPAESYMMPMDDFSIHDPGAGYPQGWWKPSFGYAELLRYYIAWFRTGAQPTISKDALFWFYRTHPAAAVATGAPWAGGQTPGHVSRYVPSADGSGVVPANADTMYVSVFATAPGSLAVGQSTQAVTAGINQVALPFTVGPAPTFTLSRAGATVMSGTGADDILANPPYSDWWSSSGFVEK